MLVEIGNKNSDLPYELANIIQIPPYRGDCVSLDRYYL